MNSPLDPAISQPLSVEDQPIRLAPSLIAADWWRIAEQVQELEAAGIEWLHFDAMDGQFVPNITLGPMYLEALRPHTALHFDAHLMIETPGSRLDDFIKAGADSISVHVENQVHLHRLISHIKDAGVLAGVVLNPATSLCTLETILPELDYVLIMSVNPGFSGQPFLPLAVQKIAELRQRRDEQGLKFAIQVDGGVNATTAPLVAAAGAEILVCGSSIFNTAKTSLTDNITVLREALAA